MERYTCSTATCRKAVADIQTRCSREYFLVEPTAISNNVKVLSYYKRNREWKRDRQSKHRGELKIPPCIYRKIHFNGNILETCELDNGHVIVFDAKLTGKEYKDWFAAYKDLVWCFVMQTRAIGFYISSLKTTPEHWVRNSFGGDFKWT